MSQHNDPFSKLPIDVLIKIFSYLSAKDISAAAQTNTANRERLITKSQAQALWHGKFMQHFPHLLGKKGFKKKSNINWYEWFVRAYDQEYHNMVADREFLIDIREGNLESIASSPCQFLHLNSLFNNRVLLIDYLAKRKCPQIILDYLFNIVVRHYQKYNEPDRDSRLIRYAVLFNQSLDEISKYTTENVLVPLSHYQSNDFVSDKELNPLYVAIRMGNLQHIQLFLDKGIRVTPLALHEAAELGNSEIFNMLTTYSEEMDVSTYMDILKTSVEYHHINILKILTNDPKFTHAKNEYMNIEWGASRFLLEVRAAKNDDLDILKELSALSHVPNVSLKNIDVLLLAIVGHNASNVLRYILEDKEYANNITADRLNLAFCKAVEKGYIDILHILLSTGLIKEAYVPFYYAVKSGRMDILKLLQKQFDFNILLESCGRKKTSILYNISKYGHHKMMDYLLHNNFITEDDIRHHAQVMCCEAVQNGQAEIVKHLSERRLLDINQTYMAAHALHIAARNNNVEMAKVFLAYPTCDLNTINDAGKTPLAFAVSEGNLAMTNLLLADRRTDINKICDQAGNTALTLAIHGTHKKHRAVFVSLVEHETTNINVQDTDGKTPLMLALLAHQHEFCHISMSRMLISRPDIQPNLLDKSGFTALAYAIQMLTPHRLQLLEVLLVNKTINIWTECANGKTAVSIAKELNNQGIVNLLRIKSLEDYADRRDKLETPCRLFNKSTKVNAARKQARILRGEDIELTTKEKLALKQGDLAKADQLIEVAIMVKHDVQHNKLK